MGILDYVNIRQGTKSVPRFSNGNTLPSTQLPFGMNGFSPQTESKRGEWYFHPEDRCLEGVRLTHQPSPWIGDYGCITFMPQEGGVYSSSDNRWSGYRPDEAVIRPDYLKLDFLRYNAVLELSPTERGAVIYLKYNGDLVPRFAVMPVFGNCHFEVIDNKITGWTDAQKNGNAVNFKMFFIFEFNCNIIKNQTYATKQNGDYCLNLVTDSVYDGINAALDKRDVTIKMSTSYISIEQAIINLQRETENIDFNTAKKTARDIWEDLLERVKIEDEDEEKIKTFYSCLARMYMYPNISYEIDAGGNDVHYCPHNGEVLKGKTYTNNGFWDTFRTVYPLFSLAIPEKYAQIVEGFISIYRDCGWLPRWPSNGEVGCMPGTYIDAVIADACVKEILPKETMKIALEAMIKHSVVKAMDIRYGRTGLDEYNRYGYVTNNFKESVNHTLDSCYGDFCIAQVANCLGEENIYKKYIEKSKKYALIFDSDSGFMRGKDENGTMKTDFNPLDWGDEYTESCAHQASFAVQHDLEGLANLFGGESFLLKKLDEVFETPPRYNVGGYKREIHEMTEMAAADLGQCAISNQPSFHLPYIYSYFGQIDKTQKYIDIIANNCFSFKDDGFPGDEDNGTMSGWYVFSAIGLYPICPGKPEYVKGKKLLDKIIINGREIDVDKYDVNLISHFSLVDEKYV